MQQELSKEVPNGIYLTFESEPGFDLKLDSLDRASDGIELLAVQSKGKRTQATVFVPEGKLPVLERLVEQYLSKDNVNKNTGTKTPRNRELIQNIRSIRRAALDRLWTDHPDLLPPSDAEVIWWEVWLRTGPERENLLRLFRDHAAAIGLTLSRTELWFPDRTIVAARGTRAQLMQSVTLLNCIAELRRLKETAEFFTGLPPSDQWQWSDDLVNRVEVGGANSPAICVLDTGMNLHPLVAPALAEQDRHSIDPNWGTHDAFGHGTQMGGLALYGDLCNVLPENGPLSLTHRLESVKILRHNGDNEGELYGAITREGIARAEQVAPQRDRVFCLAIASKEHRDRGRPSAWSAALDRLTSGAEDGERRLVVVSAGNVLEADQHDYPAANTVDGIHDPAQAWNVLTVGAVTYKDVIDAQIYPGYLPLAPVGGLSPYSCSAGTWARDWPIKPDVVFEGGNRARRPDGDTDSLRSLDLLSVHHLHEQRAFDSFWGTSAATALASRLAGQIRSGYPAYWPETVRGLLVHSARWTPTMMEVFAPNPNRKRDINNLLRHCGYGVPSVSRALWSANNALTLIAQQELQPFEAVRTRTGRVERVRSRDMHIYPLPWPAEALEELGETDVEMRVTLSYFVEPNPSERGWTRRYRYESHGLRFAVKKALESEQAFRARIADYARAEEEGQVVSGQDSGWIVGPNLRHHGSIHTDVWQGRASELAERGAVAVYPTLGWWRERPTHGKYADPVRYSLIVSIDTAEAVIDLYTPVAAAVEARVAVEV
ncbi:MAG TPA: S8 family peptidase [Steroidobacteraceae bacterium]|nr:S8 family peptidase [Steroidobacteraceae bacterium]